jgi:hypothetical protein
MLSNAVRRQLLRVMFRSRESRVWQRVDARAALLAVEYFGLQLFDVYRALVGFGERRQSIFHSLLGDCDFDVLHWLDRRPPGLPEPCRSKLRVRRVYSRSAAPESASFHKPNLNINFAISLSGSVLARSIKTLRVRFAMRSGRCLPVL